MILQNMISEYPSLQRELEKVHYTTRFALGLFYGSKAGPFPNLDNIHVINFSDDPIIRYWSVENKKRGKGDQEPCVIVAHTSVSFGSENIDKLSDDVKDFLLEKVGKLINKDGVGNPDFVKSHKWKYSQVSTKFVSS